MKRNCFKIAAALAAAVMCMGLAGCSDQDTSESSSETPVTAAPKVTLQQSSEPESEAESSSEDEEGDVSSDEYTPAMWLVTSPDGETMHMMGSMHALREECYPLPDYVLDVYEQADVLAVECDITDLTASFTAALDQMDNMYYTDGTILKDHLSEEQYSDIESYMSAHGEKISLYDNYRLWYLSQTLESMAMEDAQLESSKGFDMNLLRMAHDDGKEIYEVESIDFQMKLLVGISEEIYAVLLEGYSADNIELMNEQYEQLYQAWRTGDNDAITELNEADESEMTAEEIALVEEYNKILLTDRNIGMAEKAKQLMTEGKNVLYVVGAAHFSGEGGIIDLMEKDGYTFELVK